MQGELANLHQLMFVFETYVWLQLNANDSDSRRPIDMLLPANLTDAQRRRIAFMYGVEDEASLPSMLPFADSSVDLLTQQSVICYLLDSALAEQYGDSFGVPPSFQEIVAAFRLVDVANEGEIKTLLEGVHSCVLRAEASHSRGHPCDSDRRLPDTWKWRLLRDVDSIEEEQVNETFGFAYKLWLAWRSDMGPLMVADNYLELKLIIMNAGIENALEPLLRLRPADSDMVEQIVTVCADQGQLPVLAALPLPQVCFFTPADSCTSGPTYTTTCFVSVTV